MNTKNPHADAFRKMVESTGIPQPPPPPTHHISHEVVQHDFVTKRPYLWVGLLFGLLAGIAIGYFLR